jgi:hypothetical protein
MTAMGRVQELGSRQKLDLGRHAGQRTARSSVRGGMLTVLEPNCGDKLLLTGIASMTWLIDGLRRRVSNDELGLCLTEGKGSDGDLAFRLLDNDGRGVLSFYAREDYQNEVHNESAPVGTNYSVVATVFNLWGIDGKSEVTVNNNSISKGDLFAIVVAALSRAVAMYDLGFPKYVRIEFKDDWLSNQCYTAFLQSP